PRDRPPGRRDGPRGGDHHRARAASHRPRRSEPHLTLGHNGGMSAPVDLMAITLPDALTADIEHAGYYPALVADVVKAALGTEEVFSHLVHQETTFDQDAVRRHITVFVRTGTRLVIAHADDFADPAGSTGAREVATATTECIPLSAVRGVMLTHVAADPSSYVPGSLGREMTL